MTARDNLVVTVEDLTIALKKVSAVVAKLKEVHDDAQHSNEYDAWTQEVWAEHEQTVLFAQKVTREAEAG